MIREELHISTSEITKRVAHLFNMISGISSIPPPRQFLKPFITLSISSIFTEVRKMVLLFSV